MLRMTNDQAAASQVYEQGIVLVGSHGRHNSRALVCFLLKALLYWLSDTQTGTGQAERYSCKVPPKGRSDLAALGARQFDFWSGRLEIALVCFLTSFMSSHFVSSAFKYLILMNLQSRTQDLQSLEILPDFEDGSTNLANPAL